jgi:hypothetical protein
MEALIALLITTAVCAALAWVAALVAKVQLTPLALVGAGLFGMGLGVWLFDALHVSEPLRLALAGASVPVVATAVGSLAVILGVKFVPAVR